MKLKPIHILTVLVAVNVVTKLLIHVEPGLDVAYYLDQMDSIVRLHTMAPPDLPIGYLALLPFYLLWPSINAYRIGAIAVNTVTALIVYLVVKRRSTHKYTPLIASALVMFNDYIYTMTRYGLWKNQVGFLVYALFLYTQMRKQPRLTIPLTILQGLTHELCMVLQLVTLGFLYIESYKQKQGSPTRLIIASTTIIMIVSLSRTLPLTDPTYNPWFYRYFIPLRETLWGNPTFTFNYPRFMEAYTFTPVTAGLIAFMGAIILYRSPLAATGLAMHTLSWITRQGLGRRFQWQTQLPLAIIIAKHTDTTEPTWIPATLTLLVAAPYFAHLIPGAWI